MATKRQRVLLVREAFGSFKRGDVISDPAEMTRIESGPNQHHVYAAEHDVDEPDPEEPAGDAEHTA